MGTRAVRRPPAPARGSVPVYRHVVVDYPGRFETIYDRSRYVWRGWFSEARFEHNRLAESAQVFPTVSVDATCYKFPTAEFLVGMAVRVLEDFKLPFEVLNEITLKHSPNVPSSGVRAGLVNLRFLDAGLFTNTFLGPLDVIRTKVGLVMREFSRFNPQDFGRGADFAAARERELTSGQSMLELQDDTIHEMVSDGRRMALKQIELSGRFAICSVFTFR